MHFTAIAMNDEWIAIGRLASIVEKTQLDGIMPSIPKWVPGFSDDIQKDVDDGWGEREDAFVKSIQVTCTNGKTMREKRALYYDIRAQLKEIIFDMKQCAERCRVKIAKEKDDAKRSKK